MDEYTKKHLLQIVGGQITGLCYDPESKISGIEVKVGNKKRYLVWILRDPEGNGEGHLDIEEQ